MSEAATEQQEAPVEQPAPEAAGEAEATKVGPHGFPEKTPWRQMSPEHAAAYHLYQSRKHEDALKAERAKNAELAAKAGQFDALSEASKSELERERDALAKELETARAQQAEARRTFGTQLVETKLAAVARERGTTVDALRTLAGGFDRFLGDDGVNDDAVSEWVSALPAVAAPEPPPPPPRNPFGAGRQAPTPTSGVAAGADLYQRTHKKRPSA